MSRPAAESREAQSEARIVTLEELVGDVPDGCKLGVGGALLTRLPLAAVHALAARRPRDLVYVSWGGGLPLEILLGAEAIAKIVFCFSSLDIFGPAPLFREAAQDRRVIIEEWPAYGFTARLEAAKQNLPAMPFRLPMGSQIIQPGLPGLLLSPGTDTTVGYASRLDLDVLLLHAQRADRHGNVEIFGARGQDATLAFAAKRVLVTVEEIVPTDDLGTMRNSFVLPRHFVSGVTVVPSGAYPTSCLPYYTADFARLAHITGQSPPPPASPGAQTAGRLRAAASLSHCAVRAAVAELAVRHRAGGNESASADEKPATTDEIMVSWLARQLSSDSICSAGAVSPLAVTSYLLAKATHAPGLTIFVTSGGLLDIAVRPMLLSLGEVLDTASAVTHCGGEDSYRWYYQQGRVSSEIVTAAQIDRHARTNNIEVTSQSGRRVRLPGQGGMADVADLHQNFMLYLTRQSPRALVASVERVSAARSLFDPAARRAAGLRPGAVKLITNLGVFGYADDPAELVLESLHPGVSMAELRDATGFEPAVRDDLGVTPAPEPEVLRVLRKDIDPLGIRRLEFAPARERRGLLSECISAEQELVDLALHSGPGS